MTVRKEIPIKQYLEWMEMNQMKILNILYAGDANDAGNIMLKENRCYFCSNTEVKYCSICKQYLCNKHRYNYPVRLIGFLKERLK